jgi:hypothetical protein
MKPSEGYIENFEILICKPSDMVFKLIDKRFISYFTKFKLKNHLLQTRLDDYFLEECNYESDGDSKINNLPFLIPSQFRSSKTVEEDFRELKELKKTRSEVKFIKFRI